MRYLCDPCRQRANLQSTSQTSFEACDSCRQETLCMQYTDEQTNNTGPIRLNTGWGGNLTEANIRTAYSDLVGSNAGPFGVRSLIQDQGNSQQYWCPHCDCEIDHLEYTVSVSEWGSCNISREEREGRIRVVAAEHDSGDSDWNDTPDYTCPECDHSIDLSEIYLEDPNEEEV